MALTLSDYWDSSTDEYLTRALNAATAHDIVALDFDNTCVQGDTGELFHLHLSQRLRWDLDAFAAAVAPEDHRDALETYIARWRHDGGQRGDLFRALMEAFPRRIEREGPASTYAWALRLHAGLRVDEHQALTRAMLANERHRERERLVLSREIVDAPLVIQRGIRSRPAFRALIQNAQARGITPWIVSATNVWTVTIAAEDFGIPAAQVIGNQNRVEHGIITDTREGVTTWHAGKVEALRERGLTCALAAGDSWSDVPMMEYARAALLVDRGDPKLRAYAEAQGWAIVPSTALAHEAWGDAATTITSRR